MSDNHIHPPLRPATKSVDRAGGVPDVNWYVAIVNHNAEHTIARTIAARGITTYVASQRQLRIWRDGRRRHIDRVIIPSTIFIHCTEAQRRDTLKIPGIHRFLMDRAARPRPRPAIVPDTQLQQLRFMLGATDQPVEFTPAPLTPGQRVTVIRGTLRGLQGEVIHPAPTSKPTTPSSPSPKSTPSSPHIPSSSPSDYSDPSDNSDNSDLSSSASPYPPTARLLIRLDILGCATVAISPLDLQPLPA